MAFTPTPPSPTHLAQIAEALCERAERRQKASLAASRKRQVLWQNELATLRNTAPAASVSIAPTGAAGVIAARLQRIVPNVVAPSVAPPTTHSTDDDMMQARVDAYYARMARHFTPTPSAAPAEASVGRVSEKRAPQRAAEQPARIMEPVLTAAPVRSAIAPVPEKALLAPAVVDQAVVEPDAVEKQEEQVARPSLIDAIVNAFNNFVDGIKNDDEHDSGKKTDPITVGAAGQLLMVLMSLGKH